MALLVGGPRRAFIREAGTGDTFKLLNNINGLRAAYCETFALARKAGLDTGQLLEALRPGLSDSTVLEAMTHQVLDDDRTHQFGAALEDVTLFCVLAAEFRHRYGRRRAPYSAALLFRQV